MKNKSEFIRRNLSAASLISIYVVTVMIHLFVDSFILGNQIDILVTMLPFILLGLALDFILRHNKAIDTGIKILAQLMPAAIFALQLMSTFFVATRKEPIEIFNYLFWLFLALPFFIGSYKKDTHKQKFTYSMIGAGSFIAVYLFLTTQTDELNEGSGAVILFLSYFLAIYAASGVRKLTFLGMALGILNAIGLLVIRYIPLTEAGSTYGWDYNLSSTIDIMLLLSLLLCIVLCFLEALLSSRDPKAIQSN